MFSVVTASPQTFQQSRVKGSAAKDFLPPVFHSDSGKPQGSLLFGLHISPEGFSQNVLTIETVLGYNTDPAGCSKCHRPLSGPACGSRLLGAVRAIWRWLKWEAKKQVLRPRCSLPWPLFIEKHPQSMSTYQIGFKCILRISFFHFIDWHLK